MIEFRSALKEESAQLALISNECGSDHWSESSFISEFDHNSIIECCECDGKIFAFAVVSVSFDEGYLHLIAVDSNYRKQGIATKLLNRCEQLAISRNVFKIILDVRVSNESAINLYDKNGYTKICERKSFYSHPTENAFTMVKEFSK